MGDTDFLGRGWGFPPSFSIKERSVKMVSDDEDIQDSLKILLTTQLGERFLQPRYGCSLQSLAFENFDTTTMTYLKDMIETSILYHEPRIKLLNVYAVAQDLDGAIDFDINYLIRSTNVRSNLVFPYYLTEATDRFLNS
jgi:phage baseplate assembly protein W